MSDLSPEEVNSIIGNTMPEDKINREGITAPLTDVFSEDFLSKVKIFLENNAGLLGEALDAKVEELKTLIGDNLKPAKDEIKEQTDERLYSKTELIKAQYVVIISQSEQKLSAFQQEDLEQAESAIEYLLSLID